MYDHIQQRKDEIRKSIASSIGGQSLSEEEMEKSATDFFEKGGRGEPIGSVKTFGSRQYIKTASGWKYHAKGAGKKDQNSKEDHHSDFSSRKEQDFHEGYSHRNSQLKGNKEKNKTGNEHFEAGKKAAEDHHKRDISDMPASAFEEYDNKASQASSKKKESKPTKVSKEKLQSMSNEELQKLTDIKGTLNGESGSFRNFRIHTGGGRKQVLADFSYDKATAGGLGRGSRSNDISHDNVKI